MQRVERKLREKKKRFFINIAECYWGHERYLTRSGLVPYNSALFKICENIIHGKTDVREIYHIYDNYFPAVLPEGTELLGILGNHDERRALNTFGHRGLRAAVALTCFMSNIIMDYEGSAEGEGWKVFLDNVYVNWNQFEYLPILLPMKSITLSYVGDKPIVRSASFVPVEPEIFAISFNSSSEQHDTIFLSVGRVMFIELNCSTHL